MIKFFYASFFLIAPFLISCKKKNQNEKQLKQINAGMSILELSNQTGIELFAINILKEATNSNPEHLKTFFSSGIFPYGDPNQGLQTIPNGKIVLLPGISFKIQNREDGYRILKEVGPKIDLKPYYKIFLTDGNNNDDHTAIAIVRCDDEFTPLVYMQTNGANYGLDTHKLIMKLDSLSNELGLKLIGADFDWCEFEIHKDPKNWNDLAKRLYDICPDIVEQGTGDLETLEESLKESKQLYFWFD